MGPWQHAGNGKVGFIWDMSSSFGHGALWASLTAISGDGGICLTELPVIPLPVPCTHVSHPTTGLCIRPATDQGFVVSHLGNHEPHWPVVCFFF